MRAVNFKGDVYTGKDKLGPENSVGIPVTKMYKPCYSQIVQLFPNELPWNGFPVTGITPVRMFIIHKSTNKKKPNLFIML